MGNENNGLYCPVKCGKCRKDCAFGFSYFDDEGNSTGWTCGIALLLDKLVNVGKDG